MIISGSSKAGKFPSPFGVRVLKFDTDEVYATPHVEFPSPFGVRVLKWSARGKSHGSRNTFPSPFGVRVLKSAGLYNMRRQVHGVSVPFRGSCSEMKRLLALIRLPMTVGFRPLSGFVF